MSTLHAFFTSKHIAIIGASRSPAKVGYQIVANLHQNTQLTLYPINPNMHRLQGLTVYPSVLAVENSIDLAIITVPLPFVESVIDECIEKHIPNIVIITAGFAEFSRDGKRIQQRIEQKILESGARLLGPNSLGFIQPHRRINASFASRTITAGSLGIISQSGAMLTAMFDEMQSRDIGCSFALSLGNKADINENDALEYAAQDPHTKCIAVYIESFSDLPRFFELASRISRTTPIVVLKGGRSKQGEHASLSHTAALATNYELLACAAEQAGFILVDTLQDFLHTAFFLSTASTIPEHVMIMTNAGGPGVHTTDHAIAQRVPLAHWDTHSKEQIEDEYPNIHANTPLDLLGDARTDRFQFALRQAQRDINIDCIMFIITQQAVTNVADIVEMLIREKGKKPILVALIGGAGLEKFRQKLNNAKIFCTAYPNQLITLLGVVTRIRKAQLKPAAFNRLINTNSTPLSTPPTIEYAFSLLRDYGFQVPRFIVAHRQDEIKQFVYPLYAKTANLALKHKKALGAIAGMVGNDQEAKAAYRHMKPFGPDVIYQELVQSNAELLLGATKDPQFGWFIAFGLGGSHTDVFQDRAYVFPKTTTRHIRDMLKTTTAYRLIAALEEQNGERGTTDAFVTAIYALQRLIIDHPELNEIEINPLMLNPQGFWAVDVKMS